MQVLVSGQQISIGSSLQDYAKSRTTEIINKYFDSVTSAHVNFSKQNKEFTCDIIVNDGTGRHTVVKSNSASDEIYSAFDLAVIKLEKQLRKYKSKLKDRSHKVKVSEVATDATKYVISTNGHDTAGDEYEVDIDNPVIVAEKPSPVLELSVGEAVMQMDLANLPALMFQNIKTGRINVVYYRKDGNISWVDSK